MRLATARSISLRQSVSKSLPHVGPHLRGGQPEESAIHRACGRAEQVVIVNYSGNSAEVWRSKNEAAFAKLKNLQVIDLNLVEVDAATRFLQRTMRLQAMIQEGCCQLMSDNETITVRPRVRKAPVH